MEFGLYGLLRGRGIEPDTLVRRARLAEQAGFESLWGGARAVAHRAGVGALGAAPRSVGGRGAGSGGGPARPRRPRGPPPPIVVGGHSAAALRRAVTGGNGWYGVYLDPAGTAEALARL